MTEEGTDEQEIPLLYHPTAKIIWNGNSVPSVPADLARWLEAMPMSRHDLQSLDCHPIDCEYSASRVEVSCHGRRSRLESRREGADSSAPDPAAPPDLIINVTGSLFSGPGVYPSHNPAERQPPQPRDKPRKFHEMFILRAMEGEGGMQPKVCPWLVL